MSNKIISSGVVHQLPKDLKNSILSDPQVLTLWESITPLARNEWICWVENAKKLATRKRRIERVGKELKEGMRSPCCFIGCIHRTDKEISPSVKLLI